MGDYALSPAEVAAMSLGRDAFFLPGPWPAELGGGNSHDSVPRPPPPPPPPPRHSAPPPPDNLAAFLELLPDELISIHHPLPAPPDNDVDEERYGPPGRRQRAEGLALERVVVREAEPCDRNCSICLEEMEVGVEARSMGCSHRYHEACILEWLRRSSSCPLCRFQLMTAG